MKILSDIVLTIASFDLIEKLLGVFWNVRHADWHGARSRGGGVGLAEEALSASIGGSSWRFEVPRGQGQSGTDIERILKRYGITVWNRGVNRHSYFFNVKKRQARWAEYLIMQTGIRVVSQPFDHRNSTYPDRHPPGWMPVPWSESGRREPATAESFGASVLDWFDHGRNSSKRTSPEASSNSKRGDDRPNRQPSAGGPEHLSPHRNSIPAREPGGWLDQLDALIDDLL